MWKIYVVVAGNSWLCSSLHLEYGKVSVLKPFIIDVYVKMNYYRLNCYMLMLTGDQIISRNFTGTELQLCYPHWIYMIILMADTKDEERFRFGSAQRMSDYSILYLYVIFFKCVSQSMEEVLYILCIYFYYTYDWYLRLDLAYISHGDLNLLLIRNAREDLTDDAEDLEKYACILSWKIAQHIFNHLKILRELAQGVF